MWCKVRSFPGGAVQKHASNEFQHDLLSIMLLNHFTLHYYYENPFF
jgi:hypothetical protein